MASYAICAGRKPVASYRSYRAASDALEKFADGANLCIRKVTDLRIVSDNSARAMQKEFKKKTRMMRAGEFRL